MRRYVLPVILFGLLTGLLNRLLGWLIIPGADFISLRPQLLIPVLISLLVGPWAGGLTAMLGNFFGDFLLGFGLYFWPSSLANFLIGFVPGTVAWIGIKSISRVNEFVIVLLFVFMGNAIALFLGFAAHVLIHEGQTLLFTLQTLYIPAVISNIYLMMLLLPPMLVLFGFMKMNIETRTMSLFLFLSLVVLSVVAGVVFVSQQQGMRIMPAEADSDQMAGVLREMVAIMFRWIGLALVLIVLIAGGIGYFFSKKYLQPIKKLGEAASELKKGAWQENQKIEVDSGDDEMKQLAELFNSMATEVVKREALMSREIERLKLTIDKKKEEKIVDEITETNFFKQLEERSLALKKKKNK